MGKLTKMQKEALALASDADSVSSGAWKAAGISIKTTSSLTDRGLLIENQFANGPYWMISGKGRAAQADYLNRAALRKEPSAPGEE